MALAHGRSIRLAVVAPLAAVVAFAAGDANGAAAPRVSCQIAKAVTRLPSRPVWFPAPMPMGTTLTVPDDAPPTFRRGLKWSVETRYFWLVRLPRGGKIADPKAKLVFTARFPNLGRELDVLRRSDGRLFAAWRTNGAGRDITAVVAKNMTGTEFGEFVASLRKVRYPARC
jgi:hypothetical protein